MRKLVGVSLFVSLILSLIIVVFKVRGFSYLEWVKQLNQLENPIQPFIDFVSDFKQVSFAFSNMSNIVDFFNATGTFFSWLFSFIVKLFNFITIALKDVAFLAQWVTLQYFPKSI